MEKEKKQSDPKILEGNKAVKRYEEIKDKGLLLFEVIVGSQSYGTNIATSDVDKKFIYIETIENVLSGDYSIQLNVTKDYTGYEIGRYIELLGKQNPNIIEILYSDEKFIEFCHPLFREILIKNRENFLSNKVAFSFGTYADTQIQKAQGTNKKFMNPMDGPRKDISEFAWLPHKQGSISLKEYLSSYHIPLEWIGLCGIDHMKYTYHAYIDPIYNDIVAGATKFVYNWKNKIFGFPLSYDQVTLAMDLAKQKIDRKLKKGYNSIYNGPIDIDGVQPKLSSIPKNEKSAFIVQFNLDGWQKYCKDYLEYHEWLEKRNKDRFDENITAGESYDLKNGMHCIRLLNMCIEILSGDGVNVYRKDREELLKIRSGNFTYQMLLEQAKEKQDRIKELYKTTTLPDNCDKMMMNEIICNFRKRFYNI